MIRVKRVNGGLIDTSCNVDRQSHGEACQPSRHTPLFLFSALLAPSGDFFFFFLAGRIAVPHTVIYRMIRARKKYSKIAADRR